MSRHIGIICKIKKNIVIHKYSAEYGKTLMISQTCQVYSIMTS